MEKIKNETIFFASILLILSLISFFILKKFIIVVFFTVILVYVLKPFHIFLKNICKSQILTSVIVMLLFLLSIFLPIAYAFLEFSQEIKDIDTDILENRIADFSIYLNQNFAININLVKEFNAFKQGLSSNIESLIYLLPEIILELFIIVFLYYYFSKERNTEFEYLRSIFSDKRFIELKNKIHQLVHAIVYGQIFVRFVQAMIGTVGFLLLGINGAIIWGFIMFFAAFLPIVGTALVWVPLAVIALIKGEILLAVLILLLGVFISIIDNLLLPFVISGNSNIGPVLTLLSILGGIELFGIYGLILGPLFLGLFLLFLKEVIDDIKVYSADFSKFVWSSEEREKYRSLKSDIAKEEYKKILNRKYEKMKNSKLRHIEVNK